MLRVFQYLTVVKENLRTVDGRNPASQLRLVVYPIICMGCIHPRWLLGISSINISSKKSKVLNKFRT